MSLARLRRQTIESGRDHPFVEAILSELRDRIESLRTVLEKEAGQSADNNNVRMYQVGGRILELASTIRLIESAEGVDE